MALVVVGVGLRPYALHVVRKNESPLPDVEPGHQRLLELTAGHQVTDGDLVPGDELLAAVPKPDCLDLLVRKEIRVVSSGQIRMIDTGCRAVGARIFKNKLMPFAKHVKFKL